MQSTNSSSAVAISGLGPLCPLAPDLSSLTALTSSGIAEARRTADWFQPEVYFGKRGFKYLMPAARYAAGAAQAALADASLSREDYPARERGVCIGTNWGGAAVLAGLDEVILSRGADSLSPMTAPQFSINLVASPISERHGMTAFNMTLTSPMVAGLEAVILGTRAIRAGRATLVTAGATEDASPVPGDSLAGVPVGDGGACLVVLESAEDVAARKRQPYAVLGGGALRFLPGLAAGAGEQAAQAEWLLGRDLERLVGDVPRSLHLCSPIGPSRVGQRVQAWLEGWLRERGIDVIYQHYPAEMVSLMTVAPMLQLAGLAATRCDGLVVGTSSFGHVALLRIKRPDNLEN
jgi:3-oxoacyl-[acyl-carrier-protein] synthase II